MVEQLQNQNPLEPTDTNTFMQQMVSYASYDSQAGMADTMTDLSTTLKSYLTTNAVSYVGDTIEAEGDTTSLTDGSATWNYSLDSNAASTTISISDQDGNTVWEGSGETSSGDHTFTWDGTDSNGKTVDDGAYTMTVTATDSSGNEIDSDTSIVGKVTGVTDDSDGNALLLIGDVSVALNDLLSVNA